MMISKHLSFSLLLLEINVTLLINEIGIFLDLKKLKLLLILKLTFKFLREFIMLVIFAKLIDLDGPKNNAFLEG